MSEINFVEAFFQEEFCYDQECKHGNRVGGHAVYCHNKNSSNRKCRYGWYTGGTTPDHECPYYEKNESNLQSNIADVTLGGDI